MGGSAESEFPLLSALGLYAADIRGDGNCLFNALSDQLYGHQNEHANIRLKVISYMREHADYYKQFIDVNPGGGIRRNPKRKNVHVASSANFVPPSRSDIDRVFDSHLQSMARGGTYGDNMEITAFASAFDCDVKIYQRDFAYVVSSGEDGDRPVAHIAYHIWEHYSSIRNLDGPHSGLPEVAPKLLSQQEEQTQKDKLAQAPHVLPWQIDVVSKSLPFLADKPTIKRALELTKGDINAAVSNLLDADENGSNSSYQESSSVERDHESDEDMHDAPNKKQDRRLSRASRAPKQRSTDTKHALSNLVAHDGSQETFASWESESSLSSAAESSQNSATPYSTQTSFDDSNIVVKQEAGKAASSSDAPARPAIRLKLLPPRPPDASQQRNSKTQQRQTGPRTARDRKDMKKQAQKAARKERQQAASQGVAEGQSPSQVKLSLRAKGAVEKPPVDTLRTLYI